MMYSREVEEMCVVNKGANHACAPIPVEAPDGTAALPIVPSSKITSTSTVGKHLESSICLAMILTISTIFFIKSS